MQYLEKLCLLRGTSGDEAAVRAYITAHLGDLPYTIDALGNVIVEKKGKQTPRHKIMLSAHMDEVGLIITAIEENGCLSFAPVGGIESAALLGKRVRLNGLLGVIGTEPVHLAEDAGALPQPEQMYIDIGAQDKAQAQQYVSPGDTAVFESAFVRFGTGMVKSKAIDDRFGCALLLELLQGEAAYDFTACFCTMEEIGLKGAGAAANRVKPDIAFVIESTTANDVCAVSGVDRVCRLGAGTVVSFMDRATVYDRGLYQAAMALAEQKGIAAQTKTKIAGGNDAGAIQPAACGARVLALSVPTRYIHSGCCVAKQEDMHATAALLKEMIVYAGEQE